MGISTGERLSIARQKLNAGKIIAIRHELMGQAVVLNRNHLSVDEDRITLAEHGQPNMGKGRVRAVQNSVDTYI